MKVYHDIYVDQVGACASERVTAISECDRVGIEFSILVSRMKKREKRIKNGFRKHKSDLFGGSDARWIHYASGRTP
jgi:hypothetical protein